VAALLDTSVILASLDPDEAAHEASDALLARGDCHAYVHAFAETFSILTGGRGARRIDAKTAVRLIEESVLPLVSPVVLSAGDIVKALRECESRGVRGGGIYDFLHLAAARKARAERIFTLDTRHFQAISRPGDPAVSAP